MEQREKLIELLQLFESEYPKSFDSLYYELAAEADHLLANGVVVLPCRCGECVYRDDQDVCPVYSVWALDINDNFFCGLAKRKGGD